VLPKSLAVTIKNIFMVYLQNYFNCSNLGQGVYVIW
jgi:hypothetical protein